MAPPPAEPPYPLPTWDSTRFKHKKTWRETVDGLAQGQLFNDPDFPADDSSLFHDKAGVQQWPEGIRWVRASADPALPKAVTDGGIEPGDIHQGALGDCYFLCALSVLAERPQRIERLLTTTEPNARGVYGARFHKRGLLREVVVDDYVPCLPEALSGGVTRPVFSFSKTGELWSLILEKAYAKLHGGYQQIEAGSTGEALEDLTGAPSELLQVKDTTPDALFAKLEEALGKGHVACTGTRKGDAEAEALGFISSHAYGILAVKAHGPLRLLKIRNPWGGTEWKGDWSDKSPLWTEETKAAFGWSDADDGVFFMGLADFVRFFERVSLLHLHDDYHSAALDLAPGQDTVRLTVPAGAGVVPAWVSVKTTDKRHYSKESGYEHPAVRFQVVRTGAEGQGGGGDDDDDKESLGVLHWSREAQGPRDLHERLELPLGSACTVLVYRQPAGAPVTLSVYSPVACQLEVAPDPAAAHRRVQAAYQREILRSGKPFQAEAAGEGGQQRSAYDGHEGIKLMHLAFPWGLGFALANATESLEVVESARFKLQNLGLLPASQLPTVTQEADGAVAVELRAAPGQTTAPLVFVSQRIAQAYGYESARRVAVSSVRATAPEALEAMRALALRDGKETGAYQGSKGGVRKRLLELQGQGEGLPGVHGVALAWQNDAGSGERLEEKVEFELAGLEPWQLTTGGQVSRLDGSGPFHVELGPGEVHLIFLKRTEAGLQEGYRFGSKSSYMIKPLH